MFVDQTRIYAKAGDGGNGVVSFRREKFVPRGGPDGGDGAQGGDVILRVNRHIDNLKVFHYNPRLIAKDGGHGRAWKRHGKNGKVVYGDVPPGTLIYKCRARTVSEAVAMERSEEGVDLEDLLEPTTQEHPAKQGSPAVDEPFAVLGSAAAAPTVDFDNDVYFGESPTTSLAIELMRVSVGLLEVSRELEQPPASQPVSVALLAVTLVLEQPPSPQPVSDGFSAACLPASANNRLNAILRGLAAMGQDYGTKHNQQSGRRMR